MQLIDETQAPPEVRQLYEELKQLLELPFVPNLYKAFAEDPKQLRDHVHQLQTLSRLPHLDKRTLHLIALTVAASRGCNYCINFHTAQLRKAGVSEEALAEMLVAIFYFNEVDQTDAEWNLTPDVRPS